MVPETVRLASIIGVLDVDVACATGAGGVDGGCGVLHATRRALRGRSCSRWYVSRRRRSGRCRWHRGCRCACRDQDQPTCVEPSQVVVLRGGGDTGDGLACLGRFIIDFDGSGFVEHVVLHGLLFVEREGASIQTTVKLLVDAATQGIVVADTDVFVGVDTRDAGIGVAITCRQCLCCNWSGQYDNCQSEWRNRRCPAPGWIHKSGSCVAMALPKASWKVTVPPGATP